MLLTIITTFVIGFSLVSAYKDFRKDTSLLKFVYLSRPLDYLWSFLMVLGVMTSVIFLANAGLPKFMTWSWISLISDSKSQGGNLITAPLASNSIAVVAGFWLLLSLSLPYLAKSEEEMFRSMTFGTKKRIVTNIKFGLVHMIVGVPLFVALVLAVCGFIFSIFYIKAFKKACKVNAETADSVATNVSTSIHAKYNFLIITLCSAFAILLLLIK